MNLISYQATAESARRAEQAGDLLRAAEAWEQASKVAKTVTNYEWANSRALFCMYLNKLKAGMGKKRKIPVIKEVY